MSIIHLLLIEDDEDDISFFEEGLKDSKLPFNLHTIMEGDKVMSHLFNSSELPDAIIMDLNLPRIHGKELLIKIKSNADFKNIPIIVLTTSTAREDITFCMNIGATHFITKPNSLKEYSSIIDYIMKFAPQERVKK